MDASNRAGGGRPDEARPDREVRRKTRWRRVCGYLRLSPWASSIVAGLKVGDPRRELMNEGTEAVQVLRKAGEGC